MLDQTPVAAEDITATEWLERLQPYRGAQLGRSLWELAVTIIPFAGLWLLAWASLSVSIWLTLLFAIPAAGFLVRMFLIQHDCGHGTFFRKRATNDALGRFLGVFTLTPYDVWQRSHATHHASAGNLDHRGTGDIWTLTVREYAALPWWRKVQYRIYRHPFVLFGIGPSVLFLINQRLPLGYFRAGWRYWASAMGTNAGILALGGLIYWLTGLDGLLYVHLPIVLIAASAGVWLFYVQHQFEETHWRAADDWNVHEAGLEGSSYYKLPAPLQWLTANIGLHHIHHLSSRIAFYRLPDVLRDYPELGEIRTITLRESFACARLKLWDEDAGKLVAFG
jgi:omega-6 fatty acid desaturase (delta-12 desaturase)